MRKAAGARPLTDEQRALAEAGRVVARWPYVRMLATSADMSPADARALARELLAKADAVDAEAGAGG